MPTQLARPDAAAELRQMELRRCVPALPPFPAAPFRPHESGLDQLADGRRVKVDAAQVAHLVGAFFASALIWIAGISAHTVHGQLHVAPSIAADAPRDDSTRFY